MKKTTVLLFAALSFGAVAANPYPNAKEPVNCTDVHAMAHSIMLSRQAGVQQADIQKVIHEIWGADGSTSNVMAEIVLKEAYKHPIKPTKQQRDDEAVRFSGSVMRTCFAAGGK